MNPEREGDPILRYRASTRISHWLVAITFVLAALSGLALFHPSLYGLSGVLGGGTWTRILHPFVGLVMFAVFALLAARMWRENRMEQRDWEWLRSFREVAANKEENVPEVGRYNGGQKLLFWIMVLCLLVLLASGLVIWRQYFSGYFPIGAVRFASVVHALFGLILILGIVVHIYAAIWIRGSVRAMTRGTVSRGWAYKHHRAWFRHVAGGGRSAE